MVKFCFFLLLYLCTILQRSVPGRVSISSDIDESQNLESRLNVLLPHIGERLTNFIQSVPTHNKHIFVRPKKGAYFGKNAYNEWAQ